MNFDIPQPQEGAESSPDAQALQEKFLVARGAARDRFGHPNNHEMARLLYLSLFDQGRLAAEVISENPLYPSRREVLNQPLTGVSTVKPEENDFIEAIVDAVTKRARFDLCLYPEALETVEALARIGPVRVWTTGDVYGNAEKGIVGSHEQFKRVAIAGLGDLRKKVSAEDGRNRHEVLSVYTSEDKILLVDDILTELHGQGIKRVIVFEDRAKNLQEFSKRAKKFQDLEIIMVWVRQGIANREDDGSLKPKKGDFEESLTSVDAVGNITNLLREKGMLNEQIPTAFVFDYDDVISDDTKRKEAQLRAIVEKLSDKGWLVQEKPSGQSA